jgi:outer membrane cobalamin receptor
MLKLTVGMAVAVLAVSCASSGTPARSDSDAQRTSRNRNLITQEEIKESSARDAYHAVQILRPDWLRSRGASSVRDPTPVAVVAYVDGQRFGGATSLEQFLIGTFKEIRYYNGSDATSRWGTGHAGGVILLVTR